MMPKGYKHTEETKKKIGSSLKGRRFSEEHKRKLALSKLGDKNPAKRPEVREKIRLKSLGRKSWCKGLTKDNDERVRKISEKLKGRPSKFKGIPRSEEVKRKISESSKGKIKTEEHRKNLSKAIRGRTYSEEYKRNMSKATMGRIITKETREKLSRANTGKIFSKEHKRKIKEARAKQIFPMKDTSIEVKIQGLLSLLHLDFYTHKYISEITNSYQCDIFIPVQKEIKQKIIIECDGCYWHGCPTCNLKPHKDMDKRKEIDKLRTEQLIERGFKVIRLWEHEIKMMNLNNINELIIK